MSRAIVLYLHVHQPYRIRNYSIFDAGTNHNYFDSPTDTLMNNSDVIHKVSEKSYLPTNKILLDLLNQYPEFHLSLSLTGTVIEQFERWAPETLQSFKDLINTGKVEILAETYHHSLAFFYSRDEFESQVNLHCKKIEAVFGQTPSVFRNTELAYNNDVAYWADKHGYKGILAEGWDKYLDWRSPNFIYRPKYTDNIRLLMKNYHLSDDIAFRFCDHDWREWPLTADKFCHWLNETPDGTNFNLFMDYETFGEHQWADSGIFEFLKNLPGEWLKNSNNTFMTISQAIDAFKPVDDIDIPETITWADTERDLSAWLGNPMQQEAIKALYDMQSAVLGTNDPVIIEDWRRMQTSDHFYYMCTKWFNDGDIHAYFSPYETPYIGFINYMNVWHDIRFRLNDLGVGI